MSKSASSFIFFSSPRTTTQSRGGKKKMSEGMKDIFFRGRRKILKKLAAFVNHVKMK